MEDYTAKGTSRQNSISDPICSLAVTFKVNKVIPVKLQQTHFVSLEIVNLP